MRQILVLLGLLLFQRREHLSAIFLDFDILRTNFRGFSIAAAGRSLIFTVDALGISVIESVLRAVRIHFFEPSPPCSSLPFGLSTGNGLLRFLIRDLAVSLNVIILACVCHVMGYARFFTRRKCFSSKVMAAQQLGAVWRGESLRKAITGQISSILTFAHGVFSNIQRSRHSGTPSPLLLFFVVARFRPVVADMLITHLPPSLVGGTPFTLHWNESNTVPLIEDLASFTVAVGVGENSGPNATYNYIMDFGPVYINSTANTVGPMFYELKTGIPTDIGPDASTYFFMIMSQLRLNMSVDVVNFSDHFGLTGMNGTSHTPEDAIVTRPYSPPSENRQFICNGETCDPSVALTGLALSSPTSTSVPPPMTKDPSFPAWAIALIVVAVGWLVGFVAFIIYRCYHPFRDDPDWHPRPTKWWNKLPFPSFGVSELPAGQGQYDSAELAGSVSNRFYELPAGTIQRDIHYHGIPRKDMSEIGVLETSNSVSEEPKSPVQSECADTAVTFEVSISRENGDTTLTLKSPSPQLPPNRQPLSPKSPEDNSPNESTPMLSPSLGNMSPVLAPTPSSPANEIHTITLPEISVSPPTIPISPIPSPTIGAVEPSSTREAKDVSGDQPLEDPALPSISEIESRPKPTIPPRPVRYKRNKMAEKETGTDLPAPLNEIELSSLTQISQSPSTPSRPAPPIPLPSAESASSPTPPTEREASQPPEPSPPPLPPRPLSPIPSRIAGSQMSAPSMSEQELAALAGVFAPPPSPPKASSLGNWVYK